MIERKNKREGRIAIFAVAHGVYWEQFPGLYDNMMGFHKTLCEKVRKNEVEVCDFGIVDSSEKAFSVAEKIRAASPDAVFCNMITYATSSVFAPVLKAVDAPMVLVALQPRRAMDYTKANTFMQLENDSICSVPEFTGVAIRFGKKISDIIIGTLTDDEKADAELAEWCDIAKVLHGLKGARLGLMGHVLEAMYDMHADPTAIASAFGVHVPLLEIDDLTEVYDEATDEEINAKIKLIKAEFDMPDPVSDPVTMKLTDADLYQAARSAVALDRLVEKYRLDGMAYYYEGKEGSEQRKVATSLIVGNSILNAQGIPMCGEFDIKTNIAMFIMDRLDMGGSFAELHPFDFDDNVILIGHDGPHHIKIAEGKPILRSLSKYHGKPGSGASVEFKLKEGPITMLGITQTAAGKFRFIIGEGYSKSGPIPPTGNTNTRGYFPPDTKDFIKRWCMEGPTHHYALGIGHKADVIKKIADALGIDSVIVR
ncbi:MAG: L-fucose/L-arabinose isomerase family protein [Clostridia bacterium]|nr:L-fucose/L-arabinose isomerase family protein [Clostridia bacterium]